MTSSRKLFWSRSFQLDLSTRARTRVSYSICLKVKYNRPNDLLGRQEVVAACGCHRVAVGLAPTEGEDLIAEAGLPNLSTNWRSGPDDPVEGGGPILRSILGLQRLPPSAPRYKLWQPKMSPHIGRCSRGTQASPAEDHYPRLTKPASHRFHCRVHSLAGSILKAYRYFKHLKYLSNSY